jgi:hypothetical protein
MNATPVGQARPRGHRIDPKYVPYLVPAIMAIAMSFTMSLVQTIARVGFSSNLPSAWPDLGGAKGTTTPAPLLAKHGQNVQHRLWPGTKHSQRPPEYSNVQECWCRLWVSPPAQVHLHGGLTLTCPLTVLEPQEAQP